MQYFDNRLYMDYPSGVLQVKKKILYNGYATFTFKGPKMNAEYRTFACKGVDPQSSGLNNVQCNAGPDTTLGKTTLLASEEWESELTTGNIVLKKFTPSPLLSVPLPASDAICKEKKKGLSIVQIILIVVFLVAFCCCTCFFVLCCPCAQAPGSCGAKVSNKILGCVEPLFATCAKCCIIGMVCAACANCSLWVFKCCGGKPEDTDGKKTDKPVSSSPSKPSKPPVSSLDVESSLSD